VTQIALRVEECCDWCKRPVSRCTDPSCDDAHTYAGILVRGQWKAVEPPKPAPVRSTALSA
jgi:hypothetical protein